MTMRTLREAAGLTPEQAARLTALERTTIGKIEAGQVRSPRISTLRALARTYGRSLDDIEAAVRASVLSRGKA